MPSLLFLAVTGCGLFLPTPSHREIVEIDPALSNPQLTDRVLVILEEQRLTRCRGTNLNTSESFPRCSISWWQGDRARIDRDRAIIEVGEFPTYTGSAAGHSARFRRVSDDALEITVKGVGTYLSSIPNRAVARRVATLVADGL